MTDVSHDLRSLRHVVDSSLSSKVAMFNNQVQQHQKAQSLNPFSQIDGRASPKPTFTKDEYGKPIAGSLTEMRGNKANIHVLREMLELCQIINSEGYAVNDEAKMRVIPFGELFNIYNYISDKVVGILLRARKHKLVEFEGEMLYQRRDDNVPIFLVKPITEIRKELESKMDTIKRAASPAPQATSVLLDRRAMGLDGPRGATPVSRSPSPAPPALNGKISTPINSKAPSPIPNGVQNREVLSELITPPHTPQHQDGNMTTKPPPPPSSPGTPTQNEANLQTVLNVLSANQGEDNLIDSVNADMQEEKKINETNKQHINITQQQLEVQLNLPDTPVQKPSLQEIMKTDQNNNNNNNNNLPVIVIDESVEASEPFVSCESLIINDTNDVADVMSNTENTAQN